VNKTRRIVERKKRNVNRILFGVTLVKKISVEIYAFKTENKKCHKA
jgi:hypothetical protein